MEKNFWTWSGDTKFGLISFRQDFALWLDSLGGLLIYSISQSFSIVSPPKKFCENDRKLDWFFFFFFKAWYQCKAIGIGKKTNKQTDTSILLQPSIFWFFVIQNSIFRSQFKILRDFDISADTWLLLAPQLVIGIRLDWLLWKYRDWLSRNTSCSDAPCTYHILPLFLPLAHFQRMFTLEWTISFLCFGWTCIHEVFWIPLRKDMPLFLMFKYKNP